MIGLMSDSHDNLPAIRRAMALFRAAGCRLVVHAGDVVAPFAAQELGAAGCPVKAVFGNNDGEKEGLKKALAPFGEIRRAPWIFTFDGLEIALVHMDEEAGPLADGRERGLIVFGHTHRPEIRPRGGVLIVNPGETGGWLTGKRTAALFDPESGSAEIVPLD